jgi:hypothetical protein
MRDFAQTIIKACGIFLLVSFSVLSVSAQSAIRLVLPIVSDACFNGIDDDEDGFIDYPTDTDCESNIDNSESHIVWMCWPSFPQANIGESVRWTVSVTGWNGEYSYSWSGTNLSGASGEIHQTYTSSGIKTARVLITAGADSTIVDCSPLNVIDRDEPQTPGNSSVSGGSSWASRTDTNPLVTNIFLPEWGQNSEDNLVLPSAPEQLLPKTSKYPVKIKTHTRWTLREGGRVVLTNEPVPVPPRVDNLPLFDLISDLGDVRFDLINGGLLGKVAPWELLPVSLKLINVSGTKRLDVQLRYSILSSNQESVYSSSETVAVETTASFVKMIQIPYYIIPGIYSVHVSMAYDHQTVPAVSHFPFTVEQKIGGIFTSTLITNGLFTIIALLLFSGVYIFLRKKYRHASRTAQIDYSSIATKDRTFYEIISDTIMDMRLRVGDQAILIANSIDGLHVDIDSGRVLSLSGNPSKIIAELVQKYEVELGKKVSFLFRSHSNK